MLIPPLNNKLSVLCCKLLRLREFSDFQPLGLSQLNSWFDIKHRFTAPVAYRHVNWAMCIAVEKEALPVLLEDPWHAPRILTGCRMTSFSADELSPDEERATDARPGTAT